MKILIAAGGSGGHIFPAIALGRALKASDKSAGLLFVGSNKDLDRRLFEKEGVRFSLLTANKLPYGLSIRLVPFAVKLLYDVAKSFFIILRYRPDAVIGFGGYVSFPVNAAAYVLRVPKVVHEQNVVPGRANKALFALADKVAISFEDTLKYMGENSGKAVLTGNPIRAEILKDDRMGGIRLFDLGPNKFTILVIGGSQGSHFLNETFVNAIRAMEPKDKDGLQVIHITGARDYEWALKAYGDAGIAHRVHSFIDRIEEAYAASDLVVTRSGASALFELALLGRPMILVPYPFAMSHQKDNAAVFSGNGAAVLLDEKTLSADVFKDAVLNLSGNKDKLKSMGTAARKLSLPDASQALARTVCAAAESGKNRC
jgi:UDP-N-acetylglucosamine--N-acetylmuramyl-(pentapeptide) pyrophosphoryl-undecaprenol N-acetylglucosamine transferase